jgi:hypothetical protein
LLSSPASSLTPMLLQMLEGTGTQVPAVPMSELCEQKVTFAPGSLFAPSGFDEHETFAMAMVTTNAVMRAFIMMASFPFSNIFMRFLRLGYEPSLVKGVLAPLVKLERFLCH